MPGVSMFMLKMSKYLSTKQKKKRYYFVEFLGALVIHGRFTLCRQQCYFLFVMIWILGSFGILHVYSGQDYDVCIIFLFR